MAEAFITGLMDHGFDPSYSKKTRYDGGLGHAFARVLKFLVPKQDCRVIPMMVNTYYPPAPSAKRCVQFGQDSGGVDPAISRQRSGRHRRFRRSEPHKNR